MPPAHFGRGPRTPAAGRGVWSRLALLDIRADDPGETALDGWVMLMDPDDGPSRSWLARKLWESRAAMAEEPDLDSHTDVARWILQAERAVRVCTAAGEVRAGGSQSDHPSA